MQPLLCSSLKCRKPPRYLLRLGNSTCVYQVQQPASFSAEGVEVGSPPGSPATVVSLQVTSV
eukprot:1406639-Amphidinium_carterae.1